MRRRQFIQLIYDLRAELGRSTDPAAGVSDLPSLKRTIQRNYEINYDDYDWPHLSVVTERMALDAGQRYYDFPANIDYDKVDKCILWWNGQPVPIERGIDVEHYAQFDSDSDQRSDPVCRWDVRYTDPREQMEVWPIPASAQEAQFFGKKKFEQLIDDADLCLVDDHLVILSSAIELLGDKASASQQTKLAALQKRYGRLKGRSKGGTAAVRIGLGTSSREVPSRAVIRVGR